MTENSTVQSQPKSFTSTLTVSDTNNAARNRPRNTRQDSIGVNIANGLSASERVRVRGATAPRSSTR